MKLKTLKSPLQVAKGRIETLQPLRTNTVERKRGWAGVQDRERIRARDEGLCQQCKREGKYTSARIVDHVTPLWAGGSDEASNKEVICQPHHDIKTAREARERAAM